MVSPINVEKLAAELSHYPDKMKVDFVIAGLNYGYRVGFNASLVSLQAASGNMPSALLQPSVTDDYLRNELDKGRIAGPFKTPPLPNLHVSRFGMIPKKHQPGKWRLILDLSSPRGASVNDGIPKEEFSVQYMKVDAIINGIMTCGHGTLMAKFVVESAYCNVAVHSADRRLLGMKWRDCSLLILLFHLACSRFLTYLRQLLIWWSGSLSTITKLNFWSTI